MLTPYENLPIQYITFNPNAIFNFSLSNMIIKYTIIYLDRNNLIIKNVYIKYICFTLF